MNKTKDMKNLSNLKLDKIDWFLAYSISIVMGVLLGFNVSTFDSVSNELAALIGILAALIGIIIYSLFFILIILNAKIEKIITYLREKEDGKKLLV